MPQTDVQSVHKLPSDHQKKCTKSWPSLERTGIWYLLFLHGFSLRKLILSLQWMTFTTVNTLVIFAGEILCHLTRSWFRWCRSFTGGNRSYKTVSFKFWLLWFRGYISASCGELCILNVTSDILNDPLFNECDSINHLCHMMGFFQYLKRLLSIFRWVCTEGS